MPRGDRDAETLLTDGDRGVVDRLHVDVVFGEEFVGSGFSEGGVADKDGNNMGGAGAGRISSVSLEFVKIQ